MTNGNLQFRLAAPNDASQLQRLVEDAFRAEDSRKSWTADMALGARFRIAVEEIMTKITQADSAMLIATDDNNVLVATVGVSKRSTGLARLGLLSVDQTHQRGGVGRQVLAYAEDYCRRVWSVKKLGLNALSTRQQLISWYMRCGYAKTGELSPFPYELMEGLALPNDLCFVEMEKDLDTVPVAPGAE